MKTALQLIGLVLAVLLAAASATIGWYIYNKQPVRQGAYTLQNLQKPVTVRYDERGVPHIDADNETDLYRALGYVHAQDRLFQMELARRLAYGEMAEVFGPRMLNSDKLYRTLGLREHANQAVAKMDAASPPAMALLAYLDGVNQYQASHKAPMEFDLLGIPKRPFTPQDTLAASGSMAFSVASAFKTEPVMTFIRDKLGPDYLRAFDVEWNPQGVMKPATPPSEPLSTADWRGLNQLALATQEALEAGGVALFEGSNALVISGKHTVSGEPILAGDPHLGYAIPAVWYEAHLSAPDFELYGHFQALNPMAMLGHNRKFGWTLTLFQNDDIDLITERGHGYNANQVWYQGQWVDMRSRIETIKVKGEAPITLTLRRSPRGPIVNDAFQESFGDTLVAMWWAFLETDNPLLEAFYALNRASTLDKARSAASMIHAPGLNVVWANAAGDIGWWAAAKVPIRPPGVNPTFMLDPQKGEAEKSGYYNFSFNPQEENPRRGYIVSANQQPVSRSGVPVPGYYNLPERAQRLDQALSDPERQWDSAAVQTLQLDGGSGHGPGILRDLLPVLKVVVTDPNQKYFLEPLEKWDGDYTRDNIGATLFTQLMYELAHAAMADELGENQFKTLLRTRAFDHALPRLVADADSPWWDNVKTKEKETREDIVRIAWDKAYRHLSELYGGSLLEWRWGKAHTLTQTHPLAQSVWSKFLFNIGPFTVPGGRETPNQMSAAWGPAPWAVTFGPSTRRVIDFGDARDAVGGNPAGQSGVWLDRHYADQAERFAKGIYMPQHLGEKTIAANTQSTLILQPAR